MDIDEQIALAEEKLLRLKDIRAQLEAVLGGVVVAAERKQKVCKTCGKLGHQSRTCSGTPQVANGEVAA